MNCKQKIQLSVYVTDPPLPDPPQEDNTHPKQSHSISGMIFAQIAGSGTGYRHHEMFRQRVTGDPETAEKTICQGFP